MCCLKLLWVYMQIPGRIAITFGKITASHLSGMEVKAGDQRPYGEPQPSLSVECLSCVSWTLSICLLLQLWSEQQTHGRKAPEEAS